MEQMESKNLKDVSETLLITLYARARESMRPDAMVRDDRAVEMVKRINYDFKQARMHTFDETAIIIRMREIDRFTREFLERNPAAVVVHIGCGLDTRFERVAERDGRVEWYDLDLPQVIQLRRELMQEDSARHHLIEGSILEDDWLDRVDHSVPRPFLFLAEGVLPYFEEEQVRSLFLKISKHFPGAEFVFDAMDPFTIRADNLKLKRTGMDARLHWGLKDFRGIESWQDGFRLLDEWYYFDHPEPRLKAYYWIRHFPFLARSSVILHYRLGR